MTTTVLETRGATAGGTTLRPVKTPAPEVEETGEVASAETEDGPAPAASIVRRRLPKERPAITHKFCVGGHEGYITVGLFEDDRPGEVFIRMSKQGSTVSGLTDAIGVLTSVALQHGVPLRTLVNKFSNTRFDPQGISLGHAEIKTTTSILDYIFRWLAIRFPDEPACKDS